MAAIVKISVKTNEQSKHIIHNCNILQLCAWSSNTLGLLASALWLNQNLNIQNQFTSIYDNSRLVLEGGKTLWPLLHCQGKSLRLLRKITVLYRAGPTVLVVRLMGNFQELQSTAINDSLGRVASRLTSQINWKCAKIHKEKTKWMQNVMLSLCFAVVNGRRVAPPKSLFASGAACGTAVPGACEEKTRHMLPQHITCWRKSGCLSCT